MDNEGAPRSSGLFRVMQRLELVQWKKVDDGGSGALVTLALRGKKKKRQPQGVKWK